MKDEDDFASLLDQFEGGSAAAAADVDEPREGARVRGQLVSIGSELAFVSFGGKSEGSIEVKELLDADGNLIGAGPDAYLWKVADILE